MLSEILNLCKRGKERLKKGANWNGQQVRDLYLIAVLLLVAAISFGLGRLSKIREEKTPITIENNNLTSGSLLSTSNVNNSALTQTQDKIYPVTYPQSDRVFVASKNGKKYYYAWCASVKTIKEQNRVWFATQEEAEKAGYQPAENCKGLK